MREEEPEREESHRKPPQAAFVTDGMTVKNFNLDKLGSNLWTFMSEFTPEWRHPEEAVVAQWDVAIFTKLLELALEALDRQSIVQVIEKGPFTVIGSLEGHGDSLVQMMSILPSVIERKFVFLGNYIGFGFAALEVFAFVLVLKCLYPSNVFLLRGAHEDKSCLDSFGLNEMMYDRFGLEPNDDQQIEDVQDLLEEVLSELSLVALLPNNIVCMHGGPGPILSEYGLKVLYGLDKGEPRSVIEAAAITECLWGCMTTEKGRGAKANGMPIFTVDEAEDFCRLENIAFLVRGRQLIAEGVLQHPSRVLSINSTLCYLDQYITDAAAVSIDNKSMVFHVIKMKEEDQRTCDHVKLSQGRNSLYGMHGL